jgi:endonuclease YncB( thermonuclease family)
VSKHWKPGRQTVELRPSRIRRDPVPRLDDKVEPDSPEREIWGGVAGVVLFGVVCAVLVLGVSEITSHRSAAAPASSPRFPHCWEGPAPNCVDDGDTVVIGGERVEIAGIDAPEIRGAKCTEERSRGIAAAVRLDELLNRGTVTVTGAPERDSDGQLLRHVQVDGKDVAGAMTAAGVARELGGGRRSWCAE